MQLSKQGGKGGNTTVEEGDKSSLQITFRYLQPLIHIICHIHIQISRTIVLISFHLDILFSSSRRIVVAGIHVQSGVSVSIGVCLFGCGASWQATEGIVRDPRELKWTGVGDLTRVVEELYKLGSSLKCVIGVGREHESRLTVSA
jgi:hypothetical protein